MLQMPQGIREGIARLEASCNGMTPAFPASVDAFATQFRVFHLIHTEHSRHEDTVIFPVMNAWFPNRAGQQTFEHVEHHEVYNFMKVVDTVGSIVLRSVVCHYRCTSEGADAYEMGRACQELSTLFEVQQHSGTFPVCSHFYKHCSQSLKSVFSKGSTVSTAYGGCRRWCQWQAC